MLLLSNAYSLMQDTQAACHVMIPKAQLTCLPKTKPELQLLCVLRCCGGSCALGVRDSQGIGLCVHTDLHNTQLHTTPGTPSLHS
jgi:hypothetical protein